MSYRTIWSGERLRVGTLRDALAALPEDLEVDVAYETIGAPIVEIRVDDSGVSLVVP